MFNYYPKIFYRVDSYDYVKSTDILIYTKLKDFVSQYRGITFRPYVVQNGEAPDLVSYKIYGTPKYDYALLMLNDIRNIYDEWPRSYSAFNEYLEAKFGSIAYAHNNAANYYTSDGILVSHEAWDELVDNAKYYETHFQYEERLNNAKALIKILDSNKLIRFEVELQQQISNIRETT